MTKRSGFICLDNNHLQIKLIEKVTLGWISTGLFSASYGELKVTEVLSASRGRNDQGSNPAHDILELTSRIGHIWYNSSLSTMKT